MNFNTWREQLRLMEALPRLLAGERVQQLAEVLGYGNPQAFSAMFQRVLSDTSRGYISALNQLSEID